MNPFRLFTHQKCPRCANVYSKDATFCNRCGHGRESGWRTCTACGVEVGADSDSCWSCGVDLTSQIGDKIRGGVWRREFGEVAVRIPLQFPGRVLEEGVQVADGTRGLLFVNGCHEKDLSQGVNVEKPSRTLLDRLFALEASGQDRVEAILVPTDNFEVPVQMHRPIALASGGKLQASMELSLRIVDESKIYSRLLLGRDLVTVGELEGELLNLCASALGNHVAGSSEEFLLQKQYDVAFFEEPIRRALEATLSDLGLAFVRLKDIRIIGDALDAAMQRNIEAKLHSEGLEKQFEALRSEADFRKFKSELEHGTRLSEMEMREAELLFHAKMKGRVREVERPHEIAEAKHEGEKKRIRHGVIKEILDDLHTHGAKVMSSQLDLKARKDKLDREDEDAREKNRVEQQIRLAQVLDGLSPEAILASAGKEVRVDLVAYAAASRGTQPAFTVPVPSSNLEMRTGAEDRGARTVVPGILEQRRKAVGLLYAATGTEVLAQLGTVWALEESRVVTNAHVAAVAMQYVEKGFGVWVRFPDPGGSPIPVSAMKIHPRFQEHVARVEGKEHAIPGCDLAVLDLDGESRYTLPRLGGTLLGSLGVGDSIHYVGFPGEGLPGGGSNSSAPSPLYKPGSISNLTDFSYAAVDSARAQLITFDAGIAGGASGSPLMDRQGNVVGVVSAGTMHAIRGGNQVYPDERYERIASGSLVNFAQRIDLLDELC